jgi:hypothetical protein
MKIVAMSIYFARWYPSVDELMLHHENLFVSLWCSRNVMIFLRLCATNLLVVF